MWLAEFKRRPRFVKVFLYECTIMYHVFALGKSFDENDIFLKDFVTYKVIGQSNAPDFFDIDASSGEIRIVQDLKMDPVALKTYEVIKTDHAAASIMKPD